MRLLKIVWLYLFLALVVTVLFWKNYTPGTWLTGWDNLHPEFDFRTNIIERSLFSAWQDYQGLGVRAGNAHAADLPRQLGLLLLSLVVSPNLLRYSYHFLAMLVGGIGTYEFLRRVVLRNHATCTVGSLLGALFYVLNPGTMQYFYVPYEAFSHFFASLPWLLVGVYAVLERPRPKTYIVFALFTLLAVPMNYIPTLFLVYLLIIFIVVICHGLTKANLKNALLIFTITFCINAFWLLPFADFVRQGTDFVSHVKINRIFTEEAFLRNQKFGNIADIAMLKGFLFDTTDMANTTTGQNDFMLKIWTAHLAKPTVYPIHYGLFAIATVGYFLIIMRFRKGLVALPILFAISLFALFNDNPPTGGLFAFLQTHLPIFKQIFRFPFTKILPLIALTYAIGICFSFSTILDWLTQKIRPIQRVFPPMVFGLFTIAIVYANLPSFGGYFLYPAMRVSIPSEYFDLFDFFRNQPPEGKIANLPQPTFWGWVTYDWGYRGSGFPWYGIRQPIMDRAFDVWNVYNEQYYTDLATALYTKQTAQALEEVLKRYHITYIWLDERVILPHKPGLLFSNETKALIDSSTHFSKVFESGKQTVYTFMANPPEATFLATNTFSYHPFEELIRNIHTQKPEAQATIEVDRDAIVLRAVLPAGRFVIPTFEQNSGPFLTNLNREKGLLSLSASYPTIEVAGKEISLPDNPALTLPIDPYDDGYLEVNGTLVQKGNTDPIIVYPKDNELTLFPTTPSVEADITQGLRAQPIVNCTDQQPSAKTLFGINYDEPDIIRLFGTASRPCLYYRVVDLLPETLKPTNTSRGILMVSLDTRAKGDEQARICVSEEPQTSCFYETESTPSRNPNEWIHQQFIVPIGEKDLRSLWLTLGLTASQPDSLSELSFRNIRVSFFLRPSYIQNFSPENNDVLTELRIASPSVLSIRFPIQQGKFSRISPATIQNEKRNCFALGKGNYERLVENDQQIGPYVRYSATDASSCDYFPVDASFLQAGGLVHILGRNVAGRPIKGCVSIEPPGYCLFEDIFSFTNSSWSEVNYFLPWSQRPSPLHYFMVLDNYAVGKEERVNDIASIDLYPLPVGWLSSLALYPYGTSDESNSIFTHFQSFDPGWTAWERIPLFPYLRPLKDHVLVNNWKNGWEIDKVTKQQNNKITILVFFWPQILEWIGFVLLPLPFIWSMLYLRHESSSGTKHN